MTSQADDSSRPLLEIEIIQLSNLFGQDDDGWSAGIEHSILGAEMTDAEIEELDRLDVYSISLEKQREVFVIAAFRAFMGRDPGSEEIAHHVREAAGSHAMGYHSIIASLEKQRDDLIADHNLARERSIQLTLEDIDRWSGAKKSSWWK